MGKPTGFMEYERQEGPVISPEERIGNFNEFHGVLSDAQQQLQGARCMDCGVPFCQFGGQVGGMASGCPLHNLIPETNDLVYKGNWEEAFLRLNRTHSFPEFTSHVCPALCEAACTCGLNSLPVSTKENEKAIIEYAYAHNLVKEEKPSIRTGKTVAIVGSGPSGLAAAQLLNRRGHQVTVFERKDRVGGLLRYGIPNMKLDKRIIDRRIKLMEQAGIVFQCNTDIGKDLKAQELLERFDRVILCCGASNPRDIKAPGRDANGILFAVDFLSEVSKQLMDHDYDEEACMKNQDYSFGSLKNKHVIIVGGGDTGNDCVATSIRLGAAGVVQLEIMPKPPVKRSKGNAWPEWPKILKTDYGQEEAIMKFHKDPRIYQTTIKEFHKDEKNNLNGVTIVSTADGKEKELKADIVLIAAGFLGCESYVTDAFGVERTDRTNVFTEAGMYATSQEKVFTAGDMHRGQSLVVWGIAEGRNAARAVDESLMGYTNL